MVPINPTLTLKRAALPEVLFVEDLAEVLQVSPAGARRLLRSGECGPHARLGRRLYVLRTTLIQALEDRARNWANAPSAPCRLVALGRSEVDNGT